MTYEYENVYLKDASTVVGPYEKKALLVINLIKVMMTYIMVKKVLNKPKLSC